MLPPSGNMGAGLGGRRRRHRAFLRRRRSGRHFRRRCRAGLFAARRQPPPVGAGGASWCAACRTQRAWRFRLTDEGALNYEHCRSILKDLRDAEAEVSARGATARGPSEGRRANGTWPSPDRTAAGGIAARHPDFEVHLALSDAGLEVGEDGLDVAIRIGRPDDPSVIARKIASTKRIICAAPSYLAARRMPERPADLAGHECLRLARRHRLRDRWRFRAESGVEEIKVGGHFFQQQRRRAARMGAGGTGPIAGGAVGRCGGPASRTAC